MRPRLKRQRPAVAGAQGVPPEDGIARVSYRERSLVFHIDNPEDSVQRPLVRGRLYEMDLLPSHRDLIFHGSTVIDVGANIGTHTVFYAISGARRVYPLEPNPRARALLRQTVTANSLASVVDLAYVELGAGAEAAELRLSTPDPNNLGKTMLGAEGSEAASVRPLDSLRFEGRISFIKIDVEGMEMAVLAGAEATIAAHRPGLGIEVDDSNAAPFWEWVNHHGYLVVRKRKMYSANANYVCIPMGAVPLR